MFAKAKMLTLQLHLDYLDYHFWEKGQQSAEVWGPAIATAIGNTRTFGPHLNSGPNAETKETSAILGAVFKFQCM